MNSNVFVQVVVNFHVKLQLTPKDIDMFYRRQSNVHTFFKADTFTERYKELRTTFPCKMQWIFMLNYN